MRRGHDRGPASRGDVSGVASTDGTRGDAGRPPSPPPPEKTVRRCHRRSAAAQPVLAFAAQLEAETSQAARRAQTPVRQAVPLSGAAQPHRHDHLSREVQPEAVAVRTPVIPRAPNTIR